MLGPAKCDLENANFIIIHTSFGLIQNMVWELYNVNWITSTMFISVKIKSDVRCFSQKTRRVVNFNMVWSPIASLHFLFYFYSTSIADWYIHKKEVKFFVAFWMSLTHKPTPLVAFSLKEWKNYLWMALSNSCNHCFLMLLF